MEALKKIEDEYGTWIFLVPVKDLILTKRVNFEYNIDRVNFISASRLPYRRNKFGFAVRISELRKKYHALLEWFFTDQKTYATLRLRGIGTETAKLFLNMVREELAIIALSQLGYSKRRYNSCPAMSQEYTASKLSYLVFNINSSNWSQQNVTTGKLGPLVIDDRWVNFATKVFFYDVVNIIKGRTKVAKAWRQDIRNAAILAGQSQCSSDIPQSFLWNMIAIELLLTQQGDVYRNALPERAEAFIGWSTNWKLSNYQERIRNVYIKRCNFVHDGNRDAIKVEDVLFTDHLLINILTNIVKNPKIFNSKKQLIDFSEKSKAEH